MSNKKIKILTLSDHPLYYSGVGIQTKLFIESMLQTERFQFISLAGALEHKDLTPIRTEKYGDDWKIFPVNGYGTEDMIRSVMREEKPDIMWLMTDPRYWTWLWQIEDEIRKHCPIVYYHVWDNYPAPHFNKPYYNSNDLIVSASRVTEELVREVSKDSKQIYIPHTYDPQVYKKLPSEDVLEFKKRYFGEQDKFLFFWNNRNTQRKNVTTVLWWFKRFLESNNNPQDVSLLIHTDPNERTGSNIEFNIDHLGLNNGQALLSPLKYEPEQMALLYNTVDCTINISDAEGFGLSTLESLACGTPIIVNKTGGLTEQVSDGTNTFGVGIEPSTRTIIGSQSVPYIYQDRVSESDFVDALTCMYRKSESELEELGRLGMEHVRKEYSISNFSKKWEKSLVSLYESIGSWDSKKIKNLKVHTI